MKAIITLATLTLLAITSAKTDSTSQPPNLLTFKPLDISAPFIDQFDLDITNRWIPSRAKKASSNNNNNNEDDDDDDDLLQFRGEWSWEENSINNPYQKNTKNSLVLKTPAAHHAISTKLSSDIISIVKDTPLFIIQYEVKFQNRHTCGGAYIKLLSKQEEQEFDPKTFNDKTPYTIMFGPDKCGLNNKVHFILQQKNPITNQIQEKHYETPPTGYFEEGKTGLYTLTLNPTTNIFTISVNNEIKSTGNLLKDMNPPINPPNLINDPKDKKPTSWVDDKSIPDPNAKKPDDWDESQPMEIIDQDAVIPNDWLENEPESIPDPDAMKPLDWDDEEDGEWVAPLLSNPVCEGISGCGEWTKPMMINPDYKGKWSPPLIDNPDYIGEWKPTQIPNPEYFQDLNPLLSMTPITALGFELWTIENGISFDNIYVGYSSLDASKLSKVWIEKSRVEQEYEDFELEKAKREEEEEDNNNNEQRGGGGGDDDDDEYEDYDDIVREFGPGEHLDPEYEKTKKTTTETETSTLLIDDISLQLVLFSDMWKKAGPLATITEFKFLFIAFAGLVLFSATMFKRIFLVPSKIVKDSNDDDDDHDEDDDDDEPEKEDQEEHEVLDDDDDDDDDED